MFPIEGSPIVTCCNNYFLNVQSNRSTVITIIIIISDIPHSVAISQSTSHDQFVQVVSIQLDYTFLNSKN